MHTADFSAEVAVADASAPTGLYFLGSCRCCVASPWHAWHWVPLASLSAPCAVIRIELSDCWWQLAHTGATRSACGCCAEEGNAMKAAATASSAAAAKVDLNLMRCSLSLSLDPIGKPEGT